MNPPSISIKKQSSSSVFSAASHTQLDLNTNVYLNAIKVDEVLNAIAHLIPRLFYSDPVIVLMDTFIYCRRGLTAKEVSTITAFDNTKYVEKTLRAMVDASLLSSVTTRQQSNQMDVGQGRTLSAEEKKLQQRNALGGSTTTDTFIYYLDYVKLVNISRFKLSQILQEISLSKRKRKEEFKNQNGTQIEGEFWSCSVCRTNYEPLDISLLLTRNDNEFVCPLCDSHPILKYYASPEASDINSDSIEESSKAHPVVLSEHGTTWIQPEDPLTIADVEESLYCLQSLLKKASRFETIPLKFGREKDLVDILEEARESAREDALAEDIANIAGGEMIDYQTKQDAESTSYLSETGVDEVTPKSMDKIVPWTLPSVKQKHKNKNIEPESSDDEFDN